MAWPLTSQRDEETIGAKGFIKKIRIRQIITRALYSLGYDKSRALLEEESGILLHSSAVKSFMQKVKDGKWDESVATLHMIGISDETTVKSVSFLILERKFLELIQIEKVSAALNTLRNEIVPLQINVSRLHELAACVLSPSKLSMLGVCYQDNDGAKSRSILLEKLHKFLPASVMIPEKRLEHLVEKALNVK